MRLTEQMRYPADPDAVFAMITDQAFRERVCEATGALSWSVEVSGDGEPGSGAAVVVRRVMPAEVPDAVKKLVGETLEVVQSEQWEPADGDHRRAEVLLEIEGQPAKMIGTAVLEPDGDGSVVRIDGEIKVKIPLLGGRLEKEVAKGVTAALRVENREGIAYLGA